MRRVLSIAGIVIALGATSLLVPQMIALSLQIQGGQIFNQSIRADEDYPSDAVFCTIDETDDSDARSLAREAVNKLQQSINRNDRLSQAYLLLGRSYCFLGEPEKAITAYDAYTQMRPGNPLGHLELGFALEAACQEAADQQAQDINSGRGLCTDPAIRERTAQEWKSADLVAGYFFEQAYNAFAAEDMESTARWFQRAVIFSGATDNSSELFKWSISHLATGRPLVDEQETAVTIHPVSSTTRFEGENLQWMMDLPPNNMEAGDPLSDFPTGSPEIGVMWWAGPAVTIIQVPETATYEITIRARANSPGPVTLQVEKDDIPIDRFNLDPGNPEWSELKTATVLTAGSHLLVLRFMQDTGDALIDWVQLDSK